MFLLTHSPPSGEPRPEGPPLEGASFRAAPDSRIRWIASLRGIACLLVLISHLWAIHPVYGPYASGIGKIGVWFFMLTAGFFLIKGCPQKPLSFPDVLQYYKKRLLRIWPLYALALLTARFLGLLAAPDKLWRYLLCFDSEMHFWYIPVLMQFYLIAPLFLLVYQRCVSVNAKHLFYLATTAAAILTAVVFPYTAYPENSPFLGWYLPVFCCGALLYGFLEWLAVRSFQTQAWGSLLVAASAIGFFCLSTLGRALFFGIAPDRYLQNKYLAGALLWSLLLVGCSCSGWIKDILERAAMLQWVESISYPLYLIHYLILHTIAQTMPYEWVVIITILLSFLLSYVIQYFYSLFLRRFR